MRRPGRLRYGVLCYLADRRRLTGEMGFGLTPIASRNVGVSVPLPGTEFEGAANGMCNHQFLIRANDAHRDSTGAPGNYPGVPPIALRFEFEPEKVEAVANSLSDKRGVFTNAAGKNEGVQAAEGRRISADPFFRLIAE